MVLALSKLLSCVVAMDRSRAPHALPDVCDFTLRRDRRPRPAQPAPVALPPRLEGQLPADTRILGEPGARRSSSSPAKAAGGAAFQSVASPVPAARFCPTGGITAASAPAYLALLRGQGLATEAALSVRETARGARVPANRAASPVTAWGSTSTHRC
jgi:hypothetical protein